VTGSRRAYGLRLAAAFVVILLALLGGTSRASSTTISPCTAVSSATWSPDGTQIVYTGTRWPRPARTKDGIDILQALCTMNADGTNAQPLRYTVCSKRCPGFGQMFVWLRSGILFQNGGIFRIVPGSKPKEISRGDAVAYVTNQAGTRIATQKYYPGCQGCGAPITILDARSGAVVGMAGGKKFDNVNPSLSPDGTKVAFVRDAFNDPGKTFGIWTANADGSRLRQLVKVGDQPLWSPTGGKIAYVALAGKSVALRLISAGGGTSRALIPRQVQNVFGWSPDGRYIAFESGTGSAGKLAVVDVATGRVSRLLHSSPSTAVWSPASSELLANTVSQKCWSTWRVPVDGSKPTLISSCNS